jgi:hypothetical protein
LFGIISISIGLASFLNARGGTFLFGSKMILIEWG